MSRRRVVSCSARSWPELGEFCELRPVSVGRLVLPLLELGELCELRPVGVGRLVPPLLELGELCELRPVGVGRLVPLLLELRAGRLTPRLGEGGEGRGGRERV